MRELLKKYSDYLVLFGVLGTAAGVFATIHLPGRWWRAEAFAREPHRITLKDLATNGPGDNRHVLVTDYECGHRFAYEYNARANDPRPGPEDARSGSAWIPLFPTPLPDDPVSAESPKSFVVLLATTRELATPNGHLVLNRRRAMEGLVLPYWRPRESGEARDILAKNYPDTDFGKCLILEAYTPFDKEVAPAFAGLVAVIAAGGLLFGPPTFLYGFVIGRAKREKSRLAIAEARRARAAESSDGPD